ncbi:hypothetical protein LDENG_00047350 [Lucifuga dentata]|nr:hypothetical protein LDENG_00047350 [Lucifuga dentata]
MSAFLFMVILGLCYCSKESSVPALGLPVLYGPNVALVNEVVQFECGVQTYPKNETISLQLFKEGDRAKLLAESTSMYGEMGVFPMIITQSDEGYLECVAKVRNNSLIQPTVSSTQYLKVVDPVKKAEIVVLSGPVEFFEGKTLELRCNISAGTHVSYSWLMNGQPVSQSPLRYYAHDQLFIYRTTSQDSGSYMCVATNQFNETQVFTSNSSEVQITVKDMVSNPDISFTVIKEDTQNHSAMVICQSTRGTPPITFSLYNRMEFVASMTVKERIATFKLPVILGQHLGWLQCQADNRDHTAYSRWMALEVVPVGGPVTLHYDYDTGENFAVISLRFYCKVAKGTHPCFQWFLNNTLLEGKGSFYWVVDQSPEQSMLLLAVGRSCAGTYHCEVSDSFDNTTVIRSRRRYLDKEVLNRLSISVVAAVFGCFAVLVSVVSICCWIGVVFRRRHYGKESLRDLEMKTMVAAYEDELDLAEYSDDADVVKAARVDEFDQVSEASVDDWLQIEELKKTLEDEPVEGP